MAKPDDDGFVPDDDGFVPDDDGFVPDSSETAIHAAPTRAQRIAAMEARQADETLPGPEQAPAEAPAEPGLWSDVKDLAGQAADYVGEAGKDAGLGTVSGATAEFDDELAGVANTLTTGADEAQAERQRAYEVTGETPSTADAYRGASDAAYEKMRSKWLADKDAAAERSPIAYPVGQVAGAVLMPAGRIAKGAGWLVNAAKAGLSGGALSAAAGVGSSEKRGLESLDDAAAPGAVGTVASALTGGAATPLAKYYAAISAGAKSKAAQMMADKFGKTMNSARGKVGGEVSAGSRTLEVLERAAADTSLPAELRQQAADKLASAEARALKESVVGNTVEQLDERLPRIQAAKVAKAEAAKLGRPEVLQAGADELLERPEMRSRLKSIGKDMALTGLGIGAGYAAGNVVGHEHLGSLGGGLIGTLAHSLSKPGRRLSNAAASPAFRNTLGAVGEAVSTRAPQLTAATASTVAPTSNALAEYLRLLAQEKDTAP